MTIIRQAGLECVGTVYEDQTLYDFDLHGKPTIELPLEAPVVLQAFEIFDRVMGDRI